MTINAAATVHPQELVGPLMIILLHAGVSMITAAMTTLLTHMWTAIADLPQEVTPPPP